MPGDKKIFPTIIHKNWKLIYYRQLIVLKYKIIYSYYSKHLICEIYESQNFQFNAHYQFFPNNQKFKKKL